MTDEKKIPHFNVGGGDRNGVPPVIHLSQEAFKSEF